MSRTNERQRVPEDGSREVTMVPRARPASYYGRAVLKPPVWQEDIAYYFFLGGLSAGASLLAAGADQSGRTALRRGGRLGALGSLGLGTFFLVKDLGRPERFHHMLRVAKLTSPMSVGTWILSAYGAACATAAAAEVWPAPRTRGRPARVLAVAGRPAGLVAALLAPAVAAYTAVLIADTAVPAWNAARRELPFVFTASAAASAGGLGMIVAPPDEAAPARRLAQYGAIVELAASRRLEARRELALEPYRSGEAGRLLNRASALTAAGVLGSMLAGRRSRLAAVCSGAALLAGGVYERLGIFRAGVASTTDPRYVNGG
ncbi:MAG: polysulfide reductase NrfD [Actinomycetota bacterium]|nr:polysulfide reductase NrfD [Actinomycetota bacterium]